MRLGSKRIAVLHTVGDDQRCASVFGDHVQFRALVVEILHNAVRAAIGRRMHRRFADVIDGVDVRANFFHQQFDGFQHLFLAGTVLVRGPGNARCRHERGDVDAGVDLGIGAVREQQTHHFDVCDFGRKKKRGGADQPPAIPRARPAGLHIGVPAIDICAVG